MILYLMSGRSERKGERESKMNGVKRLVWIVLALAIGAVTGWFARSVREREIGAREGRAFTSAVAESLKEPVVSGKDAADKSELAALRMRRRELERKIAATVAPEAIDPKDYSGIVFRYGKLRYDGGVTLADIRKDAPERYEDIVDWLKTNKENSLKALPKFEAYLGKFDLSRLPEEMRDVHERYMQAYSKYIKTWNRINPDDDGLAMGELAAFNLENSDAALEMGFLGKEEDAVLKWLSAEKRAREMGCSDEEASTIAYALRDYDYITRIGF